MANGIDYSFLTPRQPMSKEPEAIDNLAFEEALKARGKSTLVDVPTGLPTGPNVVETPLFRGDQSQQPTVDLTKARAAEPTPGVGVLRESSPGRTSGDVFRVKPPGAPTEPSAPTMSPMEQELQRLSAYYNGMRAAPGVAMNEDIRRGIAGQQAAIGEAVGAIEGQIPVQEQERAAMLGEGRQYVSDLERLRAQQAGQFAQRRERMAQDEAQIAQAREEFDPSRTLRRIGESPVSTAALSFAAGLVGALKGSAGQIGPNEILQEVDKAVERDTKQQLDKYQMLRDGIAVGQSNFNDMMRMGASEQQALAMTALASMDNHKRALEFAEQRVATAKDKANLKSAISQLDFQRGKIKLDIDLKNAANYVAMNRARGEGMAKILELRQKMQGMDPETRQKATQSFISLTGNERFDNAKEAAEGVGRVRSLQKSIPIDRQKALWNTTVSKLIDEALTKTSAGAADKGDAVTGAVAQYLGAALEDQRFQSAEEKNMIALAQKLVNTELRRISGGSVTSGEAVRELLSRNWKSYEGFTNWIDLAEDQAMRGLQKYEAAASVDPNVKSIMDSVLLPATMDIQDYRKFKADQQKLAGGGAL